MSAQRRLGMVVLVRRRIDLADAVAHRVAQLVAGLFGAAVAVGVPEITRRG